MEGERSMTFKKQLKKIHLCSFDTAIEMKNQFIDILHAGAN
jgi:hypothetical protein